MTTRYRESSLFRPGRTDQVNGMLLKRLSLHDYAREDSRESGMVLIVATLLIIILMSLTGVLVMFSTTEMKSLTERTETQTAFFLAEAGLESAKYEIGMGLDVAVDGVGNVDWAYDGASNVVDWYGGREFYSVRSVDLGGGSYRVTSTGTFGQASVTLETILMRISTTRFPGGAMAMVGDIDDLDIDIEKDADLVMDGGNSPAMSFTDVGVYNRVAKEFAKAVENGSMPSTPGPPMTPTNITGAPMTTFTTDNGTLVNLPIHHEPV